METYRWFSYQYLAITQGTRKSNGIPVKKQVPSKYKAALVYTNVAVCDIYPPLDLISFHTSHHTEHIYSAST